MLSPSHESVDNNQQSSMRNAQKRRSARTIRGIVTTTNITYIGANAHNTQNRQYVQTHFCPPTCVSVRPVFVPSLPGRPPALTSVHKNIKLVTRFLEVIKDNRNRTTIP